MKKIISLLFVLFTTLTASAQYWFQYKNEADELKGTEASSFHAVKIPDKGIITLDDDKDVFTFTTFEGLFNYEKYQRVFTVVNAIFGLYGENGDLLGKEEIMISVSSESPNFAIADCSRSQLKNSSSISKVASWVRNSKGSVRFVIPRYGKTDFDVTLPTMQSHKEPSQAKPKGASQSKNTKRPIRRKK